MTSSNFIKTLVRDYVSPTLKEAGFKKNGLTWNCQINKTAYVIEIQKNTPNKERIDFTINLGVWLEDIWTICWAKNAPRILHEENCFPRFRVGQLLDDSKVKRRDKWWSLSDEESINAVGEEIKSILINKCIPVLMKIKTESDAFRFSNDLPISLPIERIYLAIIQYFNGQVDLAKKTLSDLSSDEYWGGHAQKVLDRLLNTDTMTR